VENTQALELFTDRFLRQKVFTKVIENAKLEGQGWKDIVVYEKREETGNTKGGIITVPLTSGLTSLVSIYDN
jgi:hypothetical protein